MKGWRKEPRGTDHPVHKDIIVHSWCKVKRILRIETEIRKFVAISVRIARFLVARREQVMRPMPKDLSGLVYIVINTRPALNGIGPRAGRIEISGQFIDLGMPFGLPALPDCLQGLAHRFV